VPGATFGVARTRAGRLSRLVDLMQRVSSGQKSAATLAQPLQADRNAVGLVQSNSPAAKPVLIADKQPLFDVESPQSKGRAEAFVRTIKRDHSTSVRDPMRVRHASAASLNPPRSLGYRSSP